MLKAGINTQRGVQCTEPDEPHGNEYRTLFDPGIQLLSMVWHLKLKFEKLISWFRPLNYNPLSIFIWIDIINSNYRYQEEILFFTITITLSMHLYILMNSAPSIFLLFALVPVCLNNMHYLLKTIGGLMKLVQTTKWCSSRVRTLNGRQIADYK